MDHKLLIKHLEHSGAHVRLGVARVIGMVEETDALDALRLRFNAESDLDVRNALQWAGRRLKAAHERGYSTQEALLTHFGVYKELRELGDPDEVAKMRSIQNQFENDLLNSHNERQERQQRLNTGVSLGITGFAMLGGGTPFLSMGSTTSPTPMPEIESGEKRAEIRARRTPATKPSTADISKPLRKLVDSHETEERRRAIVQLGELNNPAALPHLAQTMLHDPDPELQKLAERWGKLIYWGAIYWQLERDQTIEAIMREKSQTLRAQHKLTADQSLPAQAAPPPQEQDLNAILQRAESVRIRRKQRR